MINNCPDCRALLKKRDIKKGQCWKCNSSSILDVIEKETAVKAALEKEIVEKRALQEKKEEEQTAKKKKESEAVAKKKNLSQKYNVLELYKGLAFLLMIVATGFFIYSLVQYFDVQKELRDLLKNTMITSTVSYVITMFSLFCLTKIIDFLFDLDLNKSNK